MFLLHTLVLFRSVYRMADTSFYLTQALYLVWNSLNDPIIGRLADALPSRTRRSTPIILFGPLLAVSFLLPFYWPERGAAWLPVQYLVCVCLYDLCFSVVYNAHQAVVTDVGLGVGERSEVTRAGAIGAVLAALPVSVISVESPAQLGGLALVCAVGFVWAGRAITERGARGSFGRAAESAEEWSLIEQGSGSNGVAPGNKDSVVEVETFAPPPFWELFRQLFSHRNFAVFTVYNALQAFMCSFSTSMFPLLASTLVAAPLGQSLFSAVVCLSFVLPHLFTVVLSRVASERGVHVCIMGLLLARVAIVLLAYPAGGLPGTVALFILSNRVLVEATCRLVGFIQADLADEDEVLHRRALSLAGSIAGIEALVTKPGQSLAPMVGWALLSYYGIGGGQGQVLEVATTTTTPNILHALMAVSISVSLLQLLAWNLYGLKGRYLAAIRATAQKGFEGLKV